MFVARDQAPKAPTSTVGRPWLALQKRPVSSTHCEERCPQRVPSMGPGLASAWEHGTMDALVGDARGALARCKPHTHWFPSPVLWADQPRATVPGPMYFVSHHDGGDPRSAGVCSLVSGHRAHDESRTKPLHPRSAATTPETLDFQGHPSCFRTTSELALASMWPRENAIHSALGCLDVSKTDFVKSFYPLSSYSHSRRLHFRMSPSISIFCSWTTHYYVVRSATWGLSG